MCTGQAWIPEVGLYYDKARFYSPTLGRFMQTDPIGYKDGINWYAYVGNDPINKVDPDGLRRRRVCVQVGSSRPTCGFKDDGARSPIAVRVRSSPTRQSAPPMPRPQGGASETGSEDSEIVVIGRRARTVTNFPNVDGEFQCTFIDGKYVGVIIQNTGATDAILIKLSSYAMRNGVVQTSVTNPGSDFHHQSLGSHIFWYSKVAFDFKARGSSPSGQWQHYIRSQETPPVNDIGTSINVKILTDGGQGGCK